MKVDIGWAKRFYLGRGIICMQRVNASQKLNTHTLVSVDG